MKKRVFFGQLETYYMYVKAIFHKYCEKGQGKEDKAYGKKVMRLKVMSWLLE